MKKYIIILIFLFFAGFTACKKDILNSEPLTSYSDASLWKDSSLVKLYLTYIYSTVPSQFDVPTSLLACITDEACNNRSFESANTINQAQFNAGNIASYYNNWTTYYKAIRQCNSFLENINNVPQSLTLQKRMAGEVHFLRALYYHHLHNYYGNFPIITSSLGLDDPRVFTPKATDDNCINFISAECDSAIALLPVKYTGADIGRATQGAALALKCRVHLYAGHWQQASDAAAQVMALGIYALFPDYQGMFLPANEENKEVIFDKQYVADPTGQSNSYDLFNAPPNLTLFATGVVDPTQSLVDLYEMTDGTAFDWNNPVHAAHPYLNRDPRMNASIMHDSTVWQGKIADMKPGSVWSPLSRPSVTGYYLVKMMNPNYDYLSSTVSGNNNFILFRYAELLLNYAEAQFMLGNTEVARTYVNMIRARPTVNMPPISAANFTFNSYVHERRVELAFEGLRLWDINRWKQGPQLRGGPIYGVSITGTTPRTYSKVQVETRVFLDPKMYLFPIPQAEIDKYPGGALTQSAGW